MSLTFFDVSSMSDFPAYYMLGTEDDGRTLLIHMPARTWIETSALLRTSRLRPELRSSLNIPDFIYPSPALPWGYGPILTNVSASFNKQWQTIRCELPRYVNQSGEFTADSWSRAYGLIASLALLFDCAQLANRKLSNAQARELATCGFLLKEGCDNQITEVSICARTEGPGRKYISLSAGLSGVCCSWIDTRDHHHTRATETISSYMQNAYCRLFGTELTPYVAYECKMEIRPNCSVSFSAPGDRTGIGTYTNTRGDYGIDLYDHNVDSPLQLLILLVGIAALEEYIRNNQF